MGAELGAVMGSLCKTRINDSMEYTADATGRGVWKTADQRIGWHDRRPSAFLFRLV